MRSIVVGYDATEPADRALERAAQLAETFGSKLIVTAVAELASEVGGGLHAVASAETPELHLEALEQARALLQRRPIDVEYQPAVGEPADALVEVAERAEADLIVVGTRDPGAIRRVLGQSVSQAVVRQARCDVLVVRR